jgi:hypothetical protein
MDIQVTHLPISQGQLRYAFARSAECRMAHEKSQDSLSIVYGKDFLCFALCDGVSMSFMGDLASTFLCQQLTQWLPEYIFFQNKRNDLKAGLELFLTGLVVPATAIVNDHALPNELSPIFRSVLEEKRALGSESMYICGLFDYQRDCIHLAWMGDSRLRLWPPSYFHSNPAFINSFQTHERWSSHRGPVGQVHTWQPMLSSFNRLAVYSDGLAILDNKMNAPYEDAALNEIIHSVGETPTSDDISFLEFQVSSSSL